MDDDSDDTRSRAARTAVTRARAGEEVGGRPPSGQAVDTDSPARSAPPLVVVRAASESDADIADALAKRLRAPPRRGARAAAQAGRTDEDWTLTVDGDRRILTRPDGARLELDFTAGRTAARQHESGLARQPLARAVGAARLRKRLSRAPRVVDATGGLGRDAWFIASLGCPLILIERSPLVHALLEAALARAALDQATAATAARIELLQGDAETTLDTLDRSRAEVVYLDPMYPESRRRAAVNKGMQFLHALVGGESSEGRLLNAALRTASAQVTVKRPVAAPPLHGDELFTGQRTTISSPGTRYDVYLL